MLKMEMIREHAIYDPSRNNERHIDTINTED